MKKFVIICAAMTLLCSCGGSYQRYQDEASRHRPCNCDGYHVNNATWEFSDNLGQQILVSGRCYKGMKHGSFDFFVDGTLVARTKFSRDNEIKTQCFIEGVHVVNLQTCMTSNAMIRNNQMPNNNTPVPPTVNIPSQVPAPVVKKSVWD